MFNFEKANENQQLAITSTEGPVLITAGPGTGKTYTLVQRAIYLIQEKNVRPEQILLATFTDKSAKELVTRITNELIEREIVVNINEMYIGTFHSLCLRILKENIEYTRLKKNYRTLDKFDQSYTVFQNIHRFRAIKNFETVISSKSAWRQSEEICMLTNILAEELVTPEELITDSNAKIIALSEVLRTYILIMSENNLLDFSSIQTETYYLLKNNPSVLLSLQDRLKYLMIDEYQDTNFIQEQIVFLLGREHKNICVVGDDDQGLYRFRGATIRNILEFPTKFSEGECRVIPLLINYRSNSDIVNFYNRWMITTDGPRFRFRWKGFRFDKTIVPKSEKHFLSPATVKLSSSENENDWQDQIYKFIQELFAAGKIKDYNQIAFLFNSVKNERVTNLANFLESKSIKVYSPRSDMFFAREEIQLVLGCLMLMFPKYVMALESNDNKYLNKEQHSYFINCLLTANSYLATNKAADFKNWIRRRGILHSNLKGTTDYSYSGLIYQMFEFEPFSNILGSSVSGRTIDLRPSRNIALFSQIVNKFEYLHRIDVLSAKNIERDTDRFFNLYIKLLFDGGISEYEDDAEYAPSGCVSFLTIHQSKGMEFPIVFVDSLSNTPRNINREILEEVELKYFKRRAFEPNELMKYFDFWRLYYTAFSRAQDLLILTCNENKRTPSMYFRELYDELEDVRSAKFDITEFEFKSVKNVNIKETFSFTSHISVYDTCSLQYKFYKELGFAPVRVSALLFGMLVHQTIEDIHRAVLREEKHVITTDNIVLWFDNNYTSLSKSEHSYLAEAQRLAALKQVLRYAKNQDGHWNLIHQAEVDVSLVKPDYIIEGKIDLIKGERDTYELVDFKSEKKPDIIKDSKRLEQYRRQLQVYAHLVEERTGKKISRMNLYYTGEELGIPTISFPYDKSEINSTINEFDITVHKILRKEFDKRADSRKVCDECDFRFYCNK